MRFLHHQCNLKTSNNLPCMPLSGHEIDLGIPNAHKAFPLRLHQIHVTFVSKSFTIIMPTRQQRNIAKTASSFKTEGNFSIQMN